MITIILGWDPAWIVALPDDVSVAQDGPGGLTFRGLGAQYQVADLPAATRAALERLAQPGAPLGEILDGLCDGSEPGALAHFVAQLRALAELGLLRITARAGNRVLAQLVPGSPSLELEGIDPDLPYVLSRFACVRREGVQLIAESPLTAGRVAVLDPRAARVLAALAQPRRPGELTHEVPDLEAGTVAALLGLLHVAGVVQPVGSSGRSPDEERASLCPWEFHDLLFHARSRLGRGDGPFGVAPSGAHPEDVPPAVKSGATTDVIPLPPIDPARLGADDPPFGRVLERRRTIREYAEIPLSVEQLGEFLFRVAHIQERTTHEIAGPEGAFAIELTLRPVPSGGALHELEYYPIIKHCRGIAPGLFRYDPAGHALEPIAGLTLDVARLLHDAGWAGGVPYDRLQVLIVYAARFRRLSWKYRGLTYALVLKHVGCAFQTMYLVATALSLAPCALGAGNSDVFARALGSDYYDETSVGEFLLGSRP